MLQRLRLSGSVIAISGLLLTAGAVALSQPHHAEASPNISSLTYTPLVLQHGWTGAPFGTRTPAVAKDANGIVHFKGAMANGTDTNPQAFTLPPAFRPTKQVFLVVDQANANVGRLDIGTDGVTNVEAETSFANARSFTSLDGVSYAQ